MTEVKVKKEHNSCSAWEVSNVQEEPELCIKQEPGEFPVHVVTVKTEDDEDKSSGFHQKPTEENRQDGSSSDTDDSDDYDQEQGPVKRSYAMVPLDSCLTDHTPFSCTDCGKIFSSDSSLQNHKSVHSGTSPHKGSVCEKTFAQNECLITHTEIHAGIIPFICPICYKGFAVKSALSCHQAFFHHICPVCCKHCSDINSLNEHLKIHAGEWNLHQFSFIFRDTVKPFSCPECGENFRLKSHLQSHMSDHAELRPHKCSVCKEKFKENKCLTEHQKQAHHFCPVCETCFPTKTKLNEHLKIHVEEGTLDPSFMIPFTCSECGATFKYKNHLSRHMSAHTRQTCQITSL